MDNNENAGNENTDHEKVREGLGALLGKIGMSVKGYFEEVDLDDPAHREIHLAVLGGRLRLLAQDTAKMCPCENCKAQYFLLVGVVHAAYTAGALALETVATYQSLMRTYKKGEPLPENFDEAGVEMLKVLREQIPDVAKDMCRIAAESSQGLEAALGMLREEAAHD